MNARGIRLFLTACMALGLACAASAAPGGGPVQALVRYPTMHGDSIVFEAGGHLWETTTAGGTAQQLTSDSGFDMAAHFSPDGRWVAFTGWYQGNTDVYVIPADGGPVKRLTFHSINRKVGKDKLRPSPDNLVLGWTPDSKDVVFLSRRDSFNPQVMHAYEVPVTGGLPTRLPLPWTGPLSFAANGHEVAYNKLARVFRPFHRKHYYGGQAQDIWTYDFDTGVSHQITHWKGADAWPMWHGDTIYFTSDRGAHGVQNLWSYSMKDQRFTQLTHFDTYDINAPTLGNDGIAFSDGGDLYVYRFGGTLEKVNVRVPIDGTSLMPHWVDAGKHVESADVAPDGKLAVFSARGALFTVPAKFGSTRTLTHDPAADEREPAWSPDGKRIAFIQAKGVGDNIAIRPAAGGRTRLLTHGDATSYQGPITWSPDGHWITYVDAHQTLWLQNVASGKRYKVANDPSRVRNSFQDVDWAPGSDWIAFSKQLEDRKQGLFLYHVTDHRLHAIGRGRFDDYEPVFTDDGKYLIFASDRLVNPAFSHYDEVLASLDSSGLYAATLSASTPSPLAPREPGAAPSGKDHGKKHKDKQAKKHTGPLHVDLDGLMSRAVRLPVPDGNIGDIVEAKGVVYYTTQPNRVLGGHLSGEKPELRAYNFKKRKDITLAKGVRGLALSADGSTLFYTAKGQWVLRPAGFKKKAKVQKLDLSHVRRWVQPRAEWATIFDEAWRDVRDYFVNPQLIAREWKGIGARYRRLLPRATSREDVTWLIANMIGTPGESHMYVFGGDNGWKSPADTTADLGAEFALDKASGRYKLAHIFRGDNTLPGYRAPLAQPGLKVAEGDYVLAIDGRPLKAPTNPYELLNGTFGSTVHLRLAHDASGKGAWTIAVKPIANAAKLHLLAWIRHNRKVVSKASHGQIGYVYLEDMETTGMREFIRQYYSQTRKKAIIFDDRWNLGGFIDPFLFDRMDRHLTGMFTNRHRWSGRSPVAFHGYMAALINRGSASDGDIFAWMFKADHLGPTIGSRTWAGVRGYNGPFTLMDGGHLIVSEDAMYGLKSQWVVENVGVEPDIRVHDQPGALNKGHDAQLDTAVEVLMKKIHDAPLPLPHPPAWTPAFPPQPAYPKCSDHLNSTTCG